jgi:hypothetical protein
LPVGEVAASEVIGADADNFATEYRLQLTYTDPKGASAAPHTLVLRISHPKQGWAHEVDFYNRVLPRMQTMRADVRWPFFICYDAAYSAAEQMSHLLREDVAATHTKAEHYAPPTPAHGQRAMEALALLHAIWWEHPQLEQWIGPLLTEPQIDSFLVDAQANRVHLLAHMAGQWSAVQEEIVNRTVAKWPTRRRAEAVRGQHVTLVHRSAHAQVALYPHDPDADTVRLTTWQTWRVDNGACDLAYFMAFWWPQEARDRLEKAMLQHYHQHLLALGVQNYTWEDCLYDYRAAVIRILFVTIANWQPTQGEWYRQAMERGMMAFQEWHCHELLP